MAASTNKRIYYAVHQVGLKPDGDTGAYNALHGVQSFSMQTNFKLEQTFELGQLAVYDNHEDIPDVQIQMSKVLDGYPLIYHRASQNATTPTLAGRSTQKSIFAASVFLDTLDSCVGAPDSAVTCSGLFVSAVSYKFPVNEAFDESVTLVGNDKVWANDPKILNSTALARSQSISFGGAFPTNTDTPASANGVNRREHFMFDYDALQGLDTNGMVADSDATILPPEIFGISTSGTNEKSNGTDFDAHITNVTVTANMNRDQQNELGRKAPYNRTLQFPIEITTEVEVTSTSGDMISAVEEGIYGTGTGCSAAGSNLRDRTIRIACCEGTRIYCGIKNRLEGSNYTGGDAKGGNVQVTYTFKTFNDFTVMHSADPNTNFLWANRNTYLRNV